MTYPLLLLCLMATRVFATSTFSFQRYDVKSGQLYMHLVTQTTQGDVLLQAGDDMLTLKGARLEGLFMLSVQVPCEQLTTGATLYWATGNTLLHASIPPQNCQLPREVTPVTVLDKQGECWLDIGDNTLWRAATEVSKLNKATVYQNMYALFLANRTAFAGEDINRLRSPLLRCPPDQLIEQIHPDDAHRLFNEMLEFNRTR
ncbi:FimV/HubP family polar landmark protein [Aeromonas jandaei]